MKHPVASLFGLFVAFLWTFVPSPAVADSSHARIVRLSLVQGDVRFAREFHQDSLNDSNANWEVAPLNLPIRQGYALATDANSRAEVEFEDGAMAFLSANTVVEFYDLSLDEGARITRLILRQGSAIFYVHPAREDYFSITGGDFSVEADGRTTFRLDNFADGSTVNVQQGRVIVLRKKESQPLVKGQSYSVNVNEGGLPVFGRSAESDDFDKWVSGRIDSVATATAYANEYANSSDYTSGLADLYLYGSWYSLPGYGFGWQPFGMGLGWCPFTYGNWYFDSPFGWNFIGSAPWGWLPYHYGGWVFNPIYGWVWVPSGLGFGGLGFAGPVRYRPVTAVWVHSGGMTGLVPLHPADVRGKSPLNLSQGVYALHGTAIATTSTPSAGESWSVLRNPPRGSLASATLTQASQPARVTRTILSSNFGRRPVTLSRDSSIVYDPGQHRFVNNNNAGAATEETRTQAGAPTAAKESAPTTTMVGAEASRTTNSPNPPHATAPPRPSVTPPHPYSGSSSHYSRGGTGWGGGHSAASSGSWGGSSHASSASMGGHASAGGGGHH
jgi:hypothetical protein